MNFKKGDIVYCKEKNIWYKGEVVDIGGKLIAISSKELNTNYKAVWKRDCVLAHIFESPLYKVLS